MDNIIRKGQIAEYYINWCHYYYGTGYLLCKKIYRSFSNEYDRWKLMCRRDVLNNGMFL